VHGGTIVGQGGVEAVYDHYLRGTPGAQRVEVNALGVAQRELSQRQPVAGQTIRLSLDSGLQREGEKALQQGMALARANGNAGNAGAFVALDPRNGDVLAMGSYPTFNPNAFVHPMTQAQYDALIAPQNGAVAPLENRAIDGPYPTGSTFKPISAMAGLQAGLITPDTTMGGGSCVTISARQFCNSGKIDDGDLNLENALKVSEDTYFYELGAKANPNPATHPHGAAIQQMARKLGLGKTTGIDLTGEYQGIVPDPAWRAYQRVRCMHYYHRVPCPLTDGNPWTIGDNVNFATGQGDLEATPLQMAVVYSTLANAYENGGKATVPRPHLGLAVDDAQGRLIQTIQPPAARTVQLNYADVATVMTGLHMATSQPGGTSADVWAGFPLPVYGKTGTAEHNSAAGGYTNDQSWYVCFIPGPNDSHPIVIAVTIEKGGFGDQAAAPAARLMASQWFGIAKKLVAGSSKTL
jgi:penicillin-binding protein 2